MTNKINGNTTPQSTSRTTISFRAFQLSPKSARVVLQRLARAPASPATFSEPDKGDSSFCSLSSRVSACSDIENDLSHIFGMLKSASHRRVTISQPLADCIALSVSTY